MSIHNHSHHPGDPACSEPAQAAKKRERVFWSTDLPFHRWALLGSLRVLLGSCPHSHGSRTAPFTHNSLGWVPASEVHLHHLLKASRQGCCQQLQCGCSEGTLGIPPPKRWAAASFQSITCSLSAKHLPQMASWALRTHHVSLVSYKHHAVTTTSLIHILMKQPCI